jgi:uncharacterized CHY-type Zn-finger protein
MTGTLSSRLLEAIVAREHREMSRRTIREHVTCPKCHKVVAVDGTYKAIDTEYVELSCGLDLPTDQVDLWEPTPDPEVLRFCQAHQEIVDHWVATKNALTAAKGTILAGACKVRLGAYDNVLRSLARAYGIEATDG